MRKFHCWGRFWFLWLFFVITRHWVITVYSYLFSICFPSVVIYISSNQWKASHYVMSLNVPVVLTQWKCNFAMNSVQYIHYNYFWLLTAFWQQYLNGTFFSRRDRHWNFRLSLYLIKSTKFLQSGALIASSFFFTIKMTYKGDQHVWTYMCNEPNQRTRSILLNI